MKQLFET